jgi:uncharacterized protein (TIGR02145 family)
MRHIILNIVIFTCFLHSIHAQVSVTKDNSLPDPSAMLDVKSSTKGMLVPRMTIAQRDAIAEPATGLLVFCTDNNQYHINKGTPAIKKWVILSSQWVSDGNNIYFNDGNAGIGYMAPAQKLSVNGNVAAQYGSSNNAAYRFGDGSANSGMSSPLPKKLSLVNNGVQSVRFDESGRVAISSGLPASPVVCGQPFTDSRDGKVYNTVQIGLQCWMKENLNVGTKINGSGEQTNNGVIEKYCYNNLESNCDVYGGLYQWNEMMNYTSSSNANPSGRQGICPTGWHIPSETEWTFLDDNLGGVSVAGGKMKETGTSHWASPNTGATNASGFTALPGGYRYSDGNFDGLATGGTFSSTYQYITDRIFCQNLRYNLQYVYFNSYDYINYGFSSRCVLD